MCLNHKASSGWFRIRKFFPTRRGRSDEVEAHEPCDVWVPIEDVGIAYEACGHVVVGLRCYECCWLSTATFWSLPRCSNPDRPEWHRKAGDDRACPEYAEATPCGECGGDMHIAHAHPETGERMWYCRPCMDSRETVHGDW